MTRNRSRCLATPGFLGAGALLAGADTGCSRAPNPPAPAARVLRASPSELFVGDVKLLEPHLGMTTGCVHLEFGPPDRFITLAPEVWQDGQKLSNSWSSSRCQRPADASISITPVACPEGKARYRITTAVAGRHGTSSSTSTRDAPAMGDTHGFTKKLDHPVEIADGPPVAVWAWLVYKHTNPFPPDVERGSFEEAAKGAKWAVVFKVGLQEPPGQ